MLCRFTQDFMVLAFLSCLKHVFFYNLFCVNRALRGGYTKRFPHRIERLQNTENRSKDRPQDRPLLSLTVGRVSPTSLILELTNCLPESRFTHKRL